MSANRKKSPSANKNISPKKNNSRGKRNALLIVGKAPRAGQVKTRLTPPLTPRRAAQLYKSFLLDAVALARAIPDTDVVILFVPFAGSEARLRQVLPRGVRLLPQEGKGIGEGSAYGFRTLLGEGYEKVVLIGSDNPTLPPAYVREAFVALDCADLILGPVDDGGYYSIGMSKPHLGVFERIAWSTELVSQQVQARAAELRLRVHLIPTWYDVDTVAELERVAAEVLRDPNHPAINTRQQIVRWVKDGVLRLERDKELAEEKSDVRG